MFDVFLHYDKRQNGQVTIYNYLDSVDKAKKLSTKMWWANFGGYIIKLINRWGRRNIWVF